MRRRAPEQHCLKMGIPFPYISHVWNHRRLVFQMKRKSSEFITGRRLDVGDAGKFESCWSCFHFACARFDKWQILIVFTSFLHTHTLEKHQNRMLNGRGPVYGNLHSACNWSLLKVTLENWSSYVPYWHSMSYVLWYNKGLCELTCVCICDYRCILCIFTLFAEQVFFMCLYLLECCYRGNLNYFLFYEALFHDFRLTTHISRRNRSEN